MAGLFQVLYGNEDGTFRNAEVLKGTDDEPLIIPLNGQPMTENICTRPFAVDWDGNNHLDLVVGNFSGTFYLFKGEGGGKFRPKPEAISTGDEPLRVEGHHSDPFVIDWDGDGDLDVLSGSASGGVYWSENVAGKGSPPELRPFQVLIEPGPSIEYGQPLSEDDLTGPTSSTRVWIADINGDGKLDVLVGDSVTLISPANGLTAEEFKKKSDAWQKTFAAAQEELSEAADQDARAKAIERFGKIYQQRTEFMAEDRTGFVWLYVRK